MKLDISPLLKKEADFLSYEFTYEQPDVDYYGDVIVCNGPVQVNGNVRKIGDQLFLETQIQVNITTHCARCLEAVEQAIEAQSFEELLPAGNEKEIEPEGDVCFYEGFHLDLLQHAQEQMMIQLPVKTLCRENCEGICSLCGQSREQGECDCLDREKNEKEPDPRLAQLRDWLEKANE
ncbi:YceD family protein [Anoxynatronum buryatiense]|uniref:DUF177 domain-containing protein n=1 Tax=Anoxynatronum buryatiense TaxID=489973 RepID=A0AA45WUG5_9CLOT|nr:DUF177 domain-containing protein [Anoxynatronum buryatiense]SMP47015.1 uncharacterized protein SAMN06296020_10388 [Anoxynatronum buryatiense]